MVELPGTPTGHRVVFEVIEGRLEGERLSAKAVSAGADWILVGPDATGMLTSGSRLRRTTACSSTCSTTGRTDVSHVSPAPWSAHPPPLGDVLDLVARHAGHLRHLASEERSLSAARMASWRASSAAGAAVSALGAELLLSHLDRETARFERVGRETIPCGHSSGPGAAAP
jgi:hypothetical protein